MSLSELQSMTVIQLRKIARENNIVLGAGVEKASMIEKIALALDIPIQPVQQSILDLPELQAAPQEAAEVSSQAAEEGIPPVEEPAVLSNPASEPAAASSDVPHEKSASATSAETPVASPAQAAAPAPAAPTEPRFQAAWRSPSAPQGGSHTSYSSTGSSRPAWQNTTPSGRPLSTDQRPQPLRPHSFGPRFGPAASPRLDAAMSAPVESPLRPAVSPLLDRRSGFSTAASFGPAAVNAAQEAAPATQTVPSPSSPSSEEPISPFSDASNSAPTLEELLATGDFEEGSGILELHPDGYGFLRASNFMPSSRDIYVSMTQIRRFSLRTGDQIQGKIRPQREGDKYAALLYIDTVNGLSEEEAQHRPHFEELTPVYPSRRMSLESKVGESLPDMRLIDLIAPLGFGQRGLILCPPDTGKRDLLQHYANTITSNYPEVTVLTLLIDLTPEDVTAFREKVSCPVLASTFDQAPEAHLRLTEMVVERAMRLVEQQKDVVILADSLTRLAKIYTSAAVQQGRSLPGMVNPASLLRAKRMFGAARAMKEGGSLTVIATMDIASGNKVDDSVVEEFKGTANMELLLDQNMVRAGIEPAINLLRSFTKNSDMLLNNQQKEGLSLIRQMLGSTSSAVAIPQLLSMMEKAKTNSELLLKMKDWFALMGM